MVSEEIRASVIGALDALPENATTEDVMETLCFMIKLRKGVEQADACEFIPHEEIEKQFLQCPRA